MHTKHPLCLASFLLLFAVGCQSVQPLQTWTDRCAAKYSFASWNIRSAITKSPYEAELSPALAIASKSNKELAKMMETYPAPDLQSLGGEWNGINKGLGSTMFGIMQDVKVFEVVGDCVQGHNKKVKQVSLHDLDCRGWEPVMDPKTCQPKTMGNFVAVAHHDCDYADSVSLDYTQAENSFTDPSRFLIDDLVMIDDQTLLGRAHAKIWGLKIPVAFFVLTRANCNNDCEPNSGIFD